MIYSLFVFSAQTAIEMPTQSVPCVDVHLIVRPSVNERIGMSIRSSVCEMQPKLLCSSSKAVVPIQL